MRRLFTARGALDDRGLRGVAVRRRGGLLAVVREGMLVTVATVMLLAAGLCFGVEGGASAAAASPTPSPSASSPPYGDTQCTPQGEGVTCKDTYSGNYAYDPLSSTGQSPDEPTVTVSQVTNLTHQVVNVSWTNFTPSFNTSGANVADPNSVASFINGVTVMECKGVVVKGQQEPPVYDGAYPSTGGPTNTCYDVFATAANSGPANMVWGYTSAGAIDTTTNQPPLSCETPGAGTACGTGSVQFQIETAVENSFLGCDDASPCYLVVMPDWGGDDGTGAGDPNRPSDPQGELDYAADCSDHTYDGTLSFLGQMSFETMQYWNYACAWADRFMIPLSFAPTPAQFCASTGDQFTAQGSPELEQAIQQWLPAWCSAKQNALNFNYNSGVDEYTARSDFLTGTGALSTDAALVTDPASSADTSGSSRKFTYAPIANTGIAIAYYIDNYTTGQPITNLKLNARLLAKLLTNSYSYSFGNCASGQTTQTQTCDPKVAGNPVNIFQDPEFYQLNPEYTPADFYNFGGVDDDTEPLVIAGDSDMTYELTRWIESDPDAAAFLAGQPDPWGMHVNAYYKVGQTYPISFFNELDPGFTQTEAEALAGPPPQYVATMQATWNPISGQDNVDQDLLDWQPSGLTFNAVCATATNQCGQPGQTSVYSQLHNDQELLGERTMFAVVDTGDSGAYQFPTAQLINSAGNAEGPTTDAMTAALDSMKTNPDKITQYQDFASTSPNAYPLTEVQYAMVPTCGESPSTVHALANFLDDVTTSQLIGTSTGELPPFGGYLPLSSAQQTQTLAAARAVSSQSCTSPPPDTTVSGQKPGSATAQVNPATVRNGASPADTTPGSGVPPTGSGLPTSSLPTAKSPIAKSSVPAEPVALGIKGADDGGLAGWMLPVALALGGLLALGGPIAYVVGTGGGASVLKRMRIKKSSLRWRR